MFILSMVVERRKVSNKFRIFLLNSFSRKNAKFCENVCEIRTKIFSRKFLFAGILRFASSHAKIDENLPIFFKLVKCTLNEIKYDQFSRKDRL